VRRGTNGTNGWLLLALIVATLAIGYVRVNGLPGTVQAGGSGARVEDEAGIAPAAASVPAPEPGQKKVVLENLGMV
jgi:hypothetical protein